MALKLYTPPAKRAAYHDGLDQSPLIVYIEDDATNWDVSYMALRRRFRLLWGKTAQEACELVTAHHDGLLAILLDIELKDSALDGVSLARLFRGFLQPNDIPAYAQTVPVLHTPILFVTAYGDRYSEAELMRAGGNQLIRKPVDFAQLSMALTSLDLRHVSNAALTVFKTCTNGSANRESISAAITADAAFSPRVAALAESGLLSHTSPSDFRAPSLQRVPVPVIRAASLVLAAVDLVPSSLEAGMLLANCLRRGAAAQLLAERVTALAPFEAFVAGILCEFGLVARARHDLNGALDIALSPADSRPLRERAAGEVEHPLRSGEIAREWHLSASEVRAIENHHNYDPPGDPLGRVVWAAERLAAVFEPGDRERSRSEAIRAAYLLGIDETRIDTILRELPSTVTRASLAFARDVPQQRTLQELRSDVGAELTVMHKAYDSLVTALGAVVGEKEALAARLRRANMRLSHEAAHDPLTGLSNRRLFDSALQRGLAYAERSNLPVALVLLDLDSFKSINDTHGHHVGDAVLRGVASTLLAATRGGDVVARCGGEEFAVVILGASAQTAAVFAERVRSELESSKFSSVPGLRVTASFGVASVWGTDCTSKAQLLYELADGALYKAKQGGRNAVRIHEP